MLRFMGFSSFMQLAAIDLALACQSRPAFLQGTCFPLFARPAPPASRTFAARPSDYVLEVIVAVIIRNFLFGLDVAQRPDEYATPIGVGLCVWIARMVGIARDIAAWTSINSDAGIDFVEVPVAPTFKADGFVRVNARAFVFGDFFTFFDRPNGEQPEACKRAADMK